MLQHVTRLFRAELEVTETGNRVAGRVVPYEAPTRVVDEEGDYVEVFTATSFAGMLQGFDRAPGRVRGVEFQIDHNRGFDHRAGFATALESGDDGLYGTFQLYDDDRTPKVRAMLESSHTGLSIDFGFRSSRTRRDGARERLGVHLYAVAATPTPVYADAQILAVRADDDPGDVITPRLDAAMARWAETFGVSFAPDAVGTPQ